MIIKKLLVVLMFKKMVPMNIFISFQLGEVEVSNLTILVLAFFSSFTFIAVGISSYKLYKSLINDDEK